MTLFSLGKIYVSDFLKTGEIPRASQTDLTLQKEDDGLIRLVNKAPSEAMYGKYWYRSGINTTMRKELKSVVESILEVSRLKDNDIWLDIACNDGTLLSFVPKNLIRIGIDPADDSFKKESAVHADLIIQDYFSKHVFRQSEFGNLKAKVVTSIAMFYDIDTPHVFIEDVKSVMDDEGVWILQLSYSPLMIRQNAFDNICHEHIYYYSLFDLKALLEDHGLKVVDCHLNDVNGGSFRVFVRKESARPFCSRPYRDVCDYRIESFLEMEKKLKMNTLEPWVEFGKQIDILKKQTVDFIKGEKEKGKTIWAYGASTKGNTLLQYFGLDSTIISGIADRSKYKWGLRTVGTDIPVRSEEEMRQERPDYLLILPWHFIDEFTLREADYLNSGGKFIVPCPKFEIIGK